MHDSDSNPDAWLVYLQPVPRINTDTATVISFWVELRGTRICAALKVQFCSVKSLIKVASPSIAETFTDNCLWEKSLLV
jgi:hypothetical protein